MKKHKDLKPKKKFRVRNFVIIGILGVVTGYIVGSFYVNNVLATTADYSLYSETELRDDVTIIQRKANGKKPSSLSAVQNFVLAEYTTNNSQNYSVYGEGRIATIASQDIVSNKIRNGDKFFFEQVSVGIKSVAERNYYTLNSETLQIVKGKDASLTNTNWSAGTVKTITVEEYREQYGVNIEGVCPYIVSSKTLVEGSSITEENGVYKFTISIHPTLSVINYVKQMKTLSGLSDFPSFQSISLSCEIDENWRFLKIDVLEKYKVSYAGLRPQCEGTLNQVFSYEPKSFEEIGG